MNIVRRPVQDAANGVGIADTSEGLSALLRAGCAAAIWRRQPWGGFQRWVEGLDPNRLPTTRVIVRRDAVCDAVQAVCETSGTPDTPERAWLIDDVTALAKVFTGLVEAPYLRLRFDVVTTDACRRFHIDAVTARLVCTYRGTGTQYGISTDGAEPRSVFTVPTGAPVVLRGTLWPGEAPSGVLHRSPPIEGTGETRLVLVLDPIRDPEEED